MGERGDGQKREQRKTTAGFDDVNRRREEGKGGGRASGKGM